MEKNKIILMLAIGTLLTPVLSLQAVETAKAVTTVQTQNTTNVPALDKAKMEELKAKLMKETEVIRKNLATDKAQIEKQLTLVKNEVKIKLAVKSQETVRTLIDNIFNKFNTQLGKLSQVDGKISEKIGILEKSGANVTNAKAQYTIAKAALDKTTSEIMALRVVSTDQISAETSKATFRSLVKQAEESIRATGSEYMKIIPMIASNNKVEVNTNNINKQ
jgi:hypothetical protein